MLAISEGQIKMTSAAASCPSATRALSTERARRTRFASCSACAGSKLAAGLIALIDSYRFLVGTPRPEPLYLEAAADSTACAALAASTVSLDRRPWRGEGPRALRSRRLARGGTARAAADPVAQASSGGLLVASATWPESRREACPHAGWHDAGALHGPNPSWGPGDAVSWPRSGNSRGKPGRRECRRRRPYPECCN